MDEEPTTQIEKLSLEKEVQVRKREKLDNETRNKRNAAAFHSQFIQEFQRSSSHGCQSKQQDVLSTESSENAHSATENFPLLRAKEGGLKKESRDSTDSGYDSRPSSTISTGSRPDSVSSRTSRNSNLMPITEQATYKPGASQYLDTKNTESTDSNSSTNSSTRSNSPNDVSSGGHLADVSSSSSQSSPAPSLEEDIKNIAPELGAKATDQKASVIAIGMHTCNSLAKSKFMKSRNTEKDEHTYNIHKDNAKNSEQSSDESDCAAQSRVSKYAKEAKKLNVSSDDGERETDTQ